MNVLILSDLHFNVAQIADKFRIAKLKRTIEDQLSMQGIFDYDLVLISGDVFESSIMKHSEINPLEVLYKLFNKDVIFCLGNHEFAFQRHQDVIKYWSNFSHPNVKCLDVEGHVVKDNINFVGNVFWYDWSLNNNRTIMKGEIIEGWLDRSIADFDAIEEHEKCKDQIFKNLSTEHKNVLITHMVPHRDLNRFSIEEIFSPYNAYSGVNDFLSEIKLKGFELEYAICGHTHEREIKDIDGVRCINIGNDYFSHTNKIVSFLFEM